MSAAAHALCRALGISLPIIQAPMAGVQGSALAIAVSGAGALGSLPCAMLGPAAIASELQAIRGATRQPYNVNFFCHAPPEADDARQARWREALRPYYAEFGLDPDHATPTPPRLPFDAETLDAIAPFAPPVVSFHFGLPAPPLLQRVKAWGATVLASATTLEEALWLERHGADVIIAQGLEAGGHRGMFLEGDITTQLGTFALVRGIVRAVRTPVIAAGGIADRAGIGAALALGAAGVQLGTVYLLCPESTTSAVHRAALQSPAARHTALTNVFTGRPARAIVNRVMRERGPMSTLAPAFPLAIGAIAPLRAAAEARGSGDFSPLWAGQDTSGCRAVAAAELTRELGADWDATGAKTTRNA
ncbi:MAG TPA: nitronate monooxygenase [Pseudomonadales bacterium]|nr:nitronate monooxygenase [Pseudomonadales bacterium]